MRLDLINKINEAKEIAVFSHVRPDGDTIGGAMSVFYCLQAMGKTAYMLCDDAPPEFLGFVDGISNFSNNCPVKRLDLAIAVDCGSLDRLGKVGKWFSDSTISINIDHHMSNNGFGTLNHVCKAEASTCQILFDLYKSEGIAITQDMARCLYVGISTDTGHFMHSNVAEKTFLQAAEIASMGVNIADIAIHLYKELSKTSTMLIATAIHNMTWYNSDTICVITLTDDKLSELGCNLGNTEGLVNYAINQMTVLVGVLITQVSDNSYKLSLRAKPRYDVASCAQAFGGGGHILAAGCSMQGSIESVTSRMVETIVAMIAQV